MITVRCKLIIDLVCKVNKIISIIFFVNNVNSSFRKLFLHFESNIYNFKLSWIYYAEFHETTVGFS
jgi:hypothetical protein